MVEQDLEPRVRDNEERLNMHEKILDDQEGVHKVVTDDLREIREKDLKEIKHKQDCLDKKIDNISNQIAEARGFWAAVKLLRDLFAALVGALVAYVWSNLKSGGP